jgi:hypothetical protein
MVELLGLNIIGKIRFAPQPAAYSKAVIGSSGQKAKAARLLTAFLGRVIN